MQVTSTPSPLRWSSSFLLSPPLTCPVKIPAKVTVCVFSAWLEPSAECQRCVPEQMLCITWYPWKPQPGCDTTATQPLPPPPRSWMIFISKLNTQWCNHCSSRSTHCLHCSSQMFLLLILSSSETANQAAPLWIMNVSSGAAPILSNFEGICGIWVIPTPPTVLNTSCPWLSQTFQPRGTCRSQSQGYSCVGSCFSATLQKPGTDVCRV